MVEPKEQLKNVVRIHDSTETRLNLNRLDKNERTIGYPEEIIKEMFSYITPDLLTAYPEPEPLYQKLSSWLGISRESILLTFGSDGAIKSVFETYVEKGDEVVIVTPSFAMYPVYCDMFGAVRREVFYNEDLSLPIEKIIKSINPKTKLIAFPNPNHPIERVFTDRELIEIFEKAQEFNTLVLIDEAYYHFHPETAVRFIQRYDNLVVARSFSKACGLASIRLGFVVSDPRNIENLFKVKPINEVSGVAIKIGEFLIDNDFLVKEYVEEVHAGRRYLIREFERMQLKTFGRHANFLLVELPESLNVEEFVASLKGEGFLVRGPFKPPIKRHIRITVGPVWQMEKFMDAFKKVYYRSVNDIAYSLPFSVDFYKKNRNKVEDVYESEKAFLCPVLKKSRSVLDVGCAAGGFYNVMKTLEPNISYTGIDISSEMIKVAKQTYPEAIFEVSDGVNLKYRDNEFDLVFCTGVLVHNPDYQNMVKEMYRVSAKYLIIDLPRLVAEDYDFDESECYTVLKNRFPSDLGDDVDEEKSKIPFFVTNPRDIFDFLLTGLAPKPKTLLAVGYYGSVAHGAVIPFERVCFCVVFMEKGSEDLPTTVWVDLPEDIAGLLEFPDEDWAKDKTKAVTDFIL